MADPLPPPRTAAIMRAQYDRAKAGELLALERDAAISLLLDAPAECSDRAPLPGRCGTCWTCRIDKFLRDAGVRR